MVQESDRLEFKREFVDDIQYTRYYRANKEEGCKPPVAIPKGELTPK